MGAGALQVCTVCTCTISTLLFQRIE